MKKLFIVAFLLTAFVGFAQKKKKGQPAPEVKDEKAVVKPADKPADKPAADTTQSQYNPLLEHFIRKYTLATRWGDQVAVKESLYDLIAETGNDSLAYTLAVYYYENNQYAPAALISKDLIARTPKNVSVLQLMGASYEGLGLKDKALPYYESIYLIDGNSAVLYKMAALQYDTKRYPECKANLDILLTKTDIDSLKVQELVGKSYKEFPIKASILNIKGLLAEQAGDKAAARKAYQDALTLAPGYPSAQENLTKLK